MSEGRLMKLVVGRGLSTIASTNAHKRMEGCIGRVYSPV
jgi:hypothetical protein